MGHGNPCSAKLLESIGANSINPVRDIQLQMLAAIRHAIDIPIDIHTENPKSSGGFIRHYEVPEMVRVAAPIYLKTGGSVAATHSWDSTDADAKKRAKQIVLVKRVIDAYYPEAIPSPKGSIEE
jgi:predicted deacylase